MAVKTITRSILNAISRIFEQSINGFCLFNLSFNTADVQHFDVVDFIPDLYVSPIVTIEYVDLAIDNKRRFYLPLLH